MANNAKRAAKRFKRENRPAKVGTWRCPGCGERHPNNERCPIPRREVAPLGFGSSGIELGVIAALAAAKGRRP